MIAQVTKLLNRQDVRKYEEQRVSRVSRFTMRKSTKREIKNCQKFPLLWKLLGSIYSFFSFVTHRWQGKEVGIPREKPDFPRHPPRATNAWYPKTSLARYCCGNASKISRICNGWTRRVVCIVSYKMQEIRYERICHVCIFAFTVIRYFYRTLYFIISIDDSRR